MREYLYFLSYARDDRDNDQYDTIRNFSIDLEKQVRLLRPLQGSVSFFDGNDIEPGDDWPESLSEALCTSRVFVPIYSATYFNSDFCGREWQIFSNRLDSYKAQNPAAKVKKLIQPVLLMAPEDVRPHIPEAISDTQFTFDEYPQDYRATGLRSLRLAGVTKAEYANFVQILARRILKVADECSLPPLDTFPDIKKIRSAFEQSVATVIRTGDVQKTRGPRYVQFIFVAGKRSELRTVRESFDSYGDEGGQDWKPFLPPDEGEIVHLAQGIAAKEKLESEIVRLGEDPEEIIQRIEEAEQQRKLVAVIVDTWTRLGAKARPQITPEPSTSPVQLNLVNCGGSSAALWLVRYSTRASSWTSTN